MSKKKRIGCECEPFKPETQIIQHLPFKMYSQIQANTVTLTKFCLVKMKPSANPIKLKKVTYNHLISTSVSK